MMRKVAIGMDYHFQWYPPSPSEMAGVDPTLTVEWPGGDETYTLEFQEYAEVIGISSDRRTLTVTWSGGTWDMIEGYPVAAIVAADERGRAPVRVIRLSDDDEIELESPLPDAIEAVGAVVRGLVCRVDILAADVPSEAVRPVRFSVEYQAVLGGSASYTLRVDMGVLAVVSVPFATGLTDGELIRIAGWTRTATPASQLGLTDVISTSLDTLVGHIRARRPDIYEDALSGEQFRRAHALLAQASLLDDQSARGQDRGNARDRIGAEFDAEMTRIFAALEFVDADGDGAHDDALATIATIGGIGIADSSLADTSADADSQPLTVTRFGMWDPR